jgi:large subunit ribosomal protein L21
VRGEILENVMFAIIRTGGKQYKVAPGQVITIEKIASAEGPVTFDEVLFLGGDKVLVGQPLISGAAVNAEVVRQFRGEKIKVFKYQAKSHWSKTKGHRQELTQVRIGDISTKAKENVDGRKSEQEKEASSSK